MSAFVQNNSVTIVGGGLAGLGLGIGLAREGVKVDLHEAGALPRHRVCGEFLCGRGREALAALGAEHILDDAAAHPSVAWYRFQNRILEQALPAPAWGLSRFAMDERLAELFTSLKGTLHLRSRFPNKLQSSNKAGLIWCTGRRLDRESQWIGLKAHARSLATSAPLEIHLGNQAYVGLSAVEDGRTNVCALFRKRPGVKASKGDLLEAYLRASGLDAVAERFKDGSPDQASHCGVAGIGFHSQRADATQARLGDFFQLIPPFTGNGMSIALESAVLAVEPMLAYARGEADWPEVCSAVEARNQKNFGWRLRAANALHPLILNPLGQGVLSSLVKSRMLPFNLLYRATH